MDRTSAENEMEVESGRDLNCKRRISQHEVTLPSCGLSTNLLEFDCPWESLHSPQTVVFTLSSFFFKSFFRHLSCSVSSPLYLSLELGNPCFPCSHW